MKITTKENNAIYAVLLEFKENGLKITQADGTCDLYKYGWLAKHETKITIKE